MRRRFVPPTRRARSGASSAWRLGRSFWRCWSWAARCTGSTRGTIETTDDAQIDAYTTQVAPRVAGQVTAAAVRRQPACLGRADAVADRSARSSRPGWTRLGRSRPARRPRSSRRGRRCWCSRRAWIRPRRMCACPRPICSRRRRIMTGSRGSTRTPSLVSRSRRRRRRSMRRRRSWTPAGRWSAERRLRCGRRRRRFWRLRRHCGRRRRIPRRPNCSFPTAPSSRRSPARSPIGPSMPAIMSVLDSRCSPWCRMTAG